MERAAVDSSVLASVGFERGTLELEFTSGSVYQYLEVPERVHAALLSAPSHGTYFNEYVKNEYRYVRLS